MTMVVVFVWATAGITLRVHADTKDTIVLRAGELYVGDGRVIQDATLVVRDGRISQVGSSLPVPEGATVIELPEGSITPGLIDADASIESDATVSLTPSRDAREVLHDFFSPRHKHEVKFGCCGSKCSRALRHVDGKKCSECGYPDANPNMAVGTHAYVPLAEESSEVIPHTRVIDAVNLRSPDFDRLLKGGVTTVFVAPDSAAVIGSQGAIVRTGGPIGTRILREADAVKATMGTDPSRRGYGNSLPFRTNVTFRSRRPTTRMGVAWVFRKAMYDTKKDAEGTAAYGADTPEPAAMHVLQRILAGEIPLRIQARERHDIEAACRLSDEFSIPFVLEEATDAYLTIGALASRKVPVIYGPIYVSPPGYRANSSEVDGARLHTMRALLDAGIETALTAQELRDEDGLARQGMYAIRFGVPEQDVLRAVTQSPAKILGIADEVGTLERGKRADVVLWRGHPFEATSAPAVVLIGGEVVLDRTERG